MSPPLCYVREVRKRSCTEPLSEPDSYLCAAAGSPQACVSTTTTQSNSTVQLGKVEVDIKHYPGSGALLIALELSKLMLQLCNMLLLKQVRMCQADYAITLKQ